MKAPAKAAPGLTGNQLKLIALITMTCDHVGMQLLPQFPILRIVGRISFPIYAFLIAEGCRHTRNRQKYLLSMAGLALLCQAVYFFAMRSLYQCVLVTFSISILLCFLTDHARRRGSACAKAAAAAAFLAAGFLCMGLPRLLPGTDFHIDYGILGCLLPVLIYLGTTRQQQLLLALWGTASLAFSMGGIQWWSLAALPLLWFYNGQRGKAGLKYLFYIYYPAHLGLIYLISLIL